MEARPRPAAEGSLDVNERDKAPPEMLDDQIQRVVEEAVEAKKGVARAELSQEPSADLIKQKEAAKRAVLHAAKKTRAVAHAASERAVSEQNALADKQIEELQQARQNAAVQLASQVAAQFSSSPSGSSSSCSASQVYVPTAQAPPQPGIPVTPVTSSHAPIPPEDPMKSAEKGLQCQKFLYEVANQTAVQATAQMSAATSLASSAMDSDTLQEAKAQAEIAQKNMALAQQMAAAAHSPSIAVQAVEAMQQASALN